MYTKFTSINIHFGTKSSKTEILSPNSTYSTSHETKTKTNQSPLLLVNTKLSSPGVGKTKDSEEERLKRIKSLLLQDSFGEDEFEDRREETINFSCNL